MLIRKVFLKTDVSQKSKQISFSEMPIFIGVALFQHFVVFSGHLWSLVQKVPPTAHNYLYFSLSMCAKKKDKENYGSQAFKEAWGWAQSLDTDS